jgi:ABC-type bacteriocin/lantibiotic exporter with double-glycine peptidase domain
MTDLNTKKMKVPFIHQGVPQNDGPACLCMVFAHHAKEVSLEEMSTACLVTEGKGSNALQMVQAARSFGMRADGGRLETSTLHLLPLPAILHWDFNHFVVLEYIDKSEATILDPAIGRVAMELEEVGRHFTGIALEVQPEEGS